MNAATDFTGEGLSFSVAGEGVSVDPATGVLRIPTDTLRDGVEVTVTATNSGGATSRFRVTVAVAPPTAVGTLADVSYDAGQRGQDRRDPGGVQRRGAELFADAAPAGVTIDAATGNISIPTAALVAAATVTVRARTPPAAASQSFKVTVAVAAAGGGRHAAGRDLRPGQRRQDRHRPRRASPARN